MKRCIYISALCLNALCLLACGDGTTTTAGDGGSSSTTNDGGSGGMGQGGATDGGGGATGPGPSAGGSGGAPILHPGVLIDDGLVARYYIDEDAADQNVGELIDAAPDPQNMTITYANDPMTQEQFMTFFENAEGNRGLAFSTIEKDSRACVSVDNNKFETELSTRRTFTYEVVADVQAVTSSYSRLMAIGLDTDHWLTLEAQSVGHIGAEIMDTGLNVAGYDLAPAGRIVMHAVFDTNQTDPKMRAVIYANGTRLQTIYAGPSLTQDLEMNLGMGRELCIGNRGIGGRTIQGVIYYGALYNVAFTADQALQNAGLLIIDDDTPAP